VNTQNDTVDHEVNAVRVDELIIDEDSGEVLELPEGAGDKVEFLTYRLVELQRDMKAYEQPVYLLKLALKRELEGLDLTSLQTQYGRAVIRSRVNRKGKAERLVLVRSEHELSLEQVSAILYCASGFTASELDGLVDANIIPHEVAEALIEETHSEWLQVSPVLKAPPAVEKVDAPH